MRPLQWTKNLFILVPLVFSGKATEVESLALSLAAVALFSALSSGIYIINDIVDKDADRLHPEKKNRPIASGVLPVTIALFFSIPLILVTLALSYMANKKFLFILVLYLVFQLLYSLYLKRVVIFDVLCVSSGFFLRVMSGAFIIGVQISKWLIVCTILLSLFIALAKRRGELVTLGEGAAQGHRAVMNEYSEQLLNQLITITSSAILVCYLLYCISEDASKLEKQQNLIFTFPFVLYGVFRYLYLIYIKKLGGTPEKLIFKDKPLFINSICWAVTSIVVLY